jgi:hypothetical protein
VHSPQAIRQAILETLPVDVAESGRSTDPESIYIPPGHIKALHLDCSLIIGARGVGKSFWTGVLANRQSRILLGESVIRDLQNIEAGIGFANTTNIKAYPDPEIFVQLLSNFEPYDIWRGVIGRWLGGILGNSEIPVSGWDSTVQWIKENPEKLATLLEHSGDHLANEGKKGLIVFDALDRTSHDWATMDTTLRGLLRAILWLKRHPGLYAKVFLREDQFARTVADFPDASKLLNTKQELNWAAHDLHGMLWQRLCNAKGHHGDCLRSTYSEVVGSPPIQNSEIWQLANEIKRDTEKQKALFEKLSGPWMGRDHRRGAPYSWVVGHLADGNGRVSPRSFIAGIRAAAQHSEERYANHDFALHYEGIKTGIQAASKIRVENEIGEEYDWVPKIMKPLAGLSVPCDFAIIKERWEIYFRNNSIQSDTLPPQASDWEGKFEELKRLGIFETMRDGRANLPDLYRVGFGIGRRGGVKPIIK